MASAFARLPALMRCMLPVLSKKMAVGDKSVVETDVRRLSSHAVLIGCPMGKQARRMRPSVSKCSGQPRRGVQEPYGLISAMEA
jgi:hypothetical protein